MVGESFIRIKDNAITKAIDLPAANALVVLLTMLMSVVSLLPYMLIAAVLFAFTVPSLINYVFAVIFNRYIHFKKNILVLFGFSYLFYLITFFNIESPVSFYVHLFFFPFAALFSVMIYMSFWVVNRIVVGKFGKLTIRHRFLRVFLPTLLIGILISLVINIFMGEFLFGLQGLL